MGIRPAPPPVTKPAPPPPQRTIKKSGRKNGKVAPPPKRGRPPKPAPPPPPEYVEDDTSWHDAFIAYISAFPNVKRACTEIGIDRRMAYRHKAKYADFSAAWEKARTLGVGAIEDRGYELATNGNPTMIIFMLKSLKPKVYSDSARLLVSGADGGAVQHKLDLSHIPSEDLRAIQRTLEALRKSSAAADNE